MTRGGRGTRFGVVTAVAVGALVLSSCGYAGKVRAVDVGDIEATLTGQAGSTETGPITYWFEYGRTDSYGTRTPTGTGEITDRNVSVPVQAEVTGLEARTTYHYRLCVDDASGDGGCSPDRTFTTTAPRDRVTGVGVVFRDDRLGFVYAATVDASSAADGSDVRGDAVAAPGSDYFRWHDRGPVTCLRVDGNRAAIGFVADNTEIGGTIVPRLIFVEDNGPTGDRLSFGSVDLPATECPAPTADRFTPGSFGGQPIGPELLEGDFVVVDQP